MDKKTLTETAIKKLEKNIEMAKSILADLKDVSYASPNFNLKVAMDRLEEDSVCKLAYLKLLESIDAKLGNDNKGKNTE